MIVVTDGFQSIVGVSGLGSPSIRLSEDFRCAVSNRNCHNAGSTRLRGEGDQQRVPGGHGDHGEDSGPSPRRVSGEGDLRREGAGHGVRYVRSGQ